MPSVIVDIRERGTAKEPNKVYKEMVVSKPVEGVYQGVLNPRNTEQVRNQQRMLRKENRLTHDLIYSTLELAYHLDGVVNDITIFPDFFCIIAHPDIITEFNKVLLVKSDEPALLSYDTTFNIGDFYLSVLVFKHVLFEGGVTIPAAFLIHDRKCGDVHDRFWKRLVQLVPNIKRDTVVIVTDREKSLNTAIKTHVPQAKLLHCWNHIRRDVKQWLRTHDGKTDDISIYPADVKALMQTDNLTAFESLYNTLSQKWSKPFDDYFNDDLRDELLESSVRWVLEAVELSRTTERIMPRP